MSWLDDRAMAEDLVPLMIGEPRPHHGRDAAADVLRADRERALARLAAIDAVGRTAGAATAGEHA